MITEERLEKIRDAVTLGREQARGFLKNGHEGKHLHELTTGLMDIIMELYDEIKEREKNPNAVYKDLLSKLDKIEERYQKSTHQLTLEKAAAVIAIRDCMILAQVDSSKAEQHYAEAYHQLVKYADPEFSFDHWGKWEKLLKPKTDDNNLPLSGS